MNSKLETAIGRGLVMGIMVSFNMWMLNANGMWWGGFVFGIWTAFWFNDSIKTLRED